MSKNLSSVAVVIGALRVNLKYDMKTTAANNGNWIFYSSYEDVGTSHFIFPLISKHSELKIVVNFLIHGCQTEALRKGENKSLFKRKFWIDLLICSIH